MRKRWIVVIISLCVLATAVIFYFQTANEDVNRYDIVAITKCRVVKEIKDEGVFSPITKVEVGSKIAGNVTEIFFTEGDLVKKGDILATVESVSARKKLEKSEAKLKTLCLQAVEAEVAMERTKITININLRHLDQNRKLDRGGIISKEDLWKAEDDCQISLNLLDEQMAKLKSIKAQIEEAQIDLDIAKIDFENSFVRSPIDGMVLAKYIEIGQTVSAGFSVFKAFDVCSPMSELEFFAKLSSIDVSAVRVGQKIKINVNTAAGIREFCSVVKEIRDNPVLENNVPIYNVICEISNRDLELKPGMTGKFFITVAEKDDVLAVPKDSLKKALVFSGKDGMVIILTGSEAIRCEIETGIYGDRLVEISGQGIKENDLIITGIKKDSGRKMKTAPWQSKSGR
ncbi:MAG: efflux RND transporter periplasmic adaptor subunit [Patescibacteria group bacterium]